MSLLQPGVGLFRTIVSGSLACARSKRSCASDSQQLVSGRCRPPDKRWFRPLCRP
jgi:hypothetical protein